MDKGHDKLVSDLKELLSEAESFEFHDSKNQQYAQPKVTLVLKLLKLIEKAKQGDYDNYEENYS